MLFYRAALRDAGLIAFADKGYHGYDNTGQHVITPNPYKGRNKTESCKNANRAGDRVLVGQSGPQLLVGPHRTGIDRHPA